MQCTGNTNAQRPLETHIGHDAVDSRPPRLSRGAAPIRGSFRGRGGGGGEPARSRHAVVLADVSLACMQVRDDGVALVLPVQQQNVAEGRVGLRQGPLERRANRIPEQSKQMSHIFPKNVSKRILWC